MNPAFPECCTLIQCFFRAQVFCFTLNPKFNLQIITGNEKLYLKATEKYRRPLL